MTTPRLVGTEASFLFCSGGSQQAYQDNAPRILGHFGRVDYLGDRPDQAAVYDLALLAAMYGMFDGTFTAIGLLSMLASPSADDHAISSIAAGKLVPMLQALVPALVVVAEQVEAGDTGARGYSNSMMLEGVRNIVKACDEAHVDSRAAKHLASVFELVVRAG